MAKLTSPVYGHGRVQFLADIEGIKRELQAGHTIRAVYDKRAKKLGVSYSAFSKLLRRYASDARPALSEPSATGPTKAHEQKPERLYGHTGHADPALIRKLTRG